MAGWSASSGGDFFEDGGCCVGRVWRLGDGAADDKEIGSGSDGGGGRGDAFLVSDGGAGWTDAGNDEGGFGEGCAGGGDFLGAADEASDAGVPSSRGEAGDLIGGRIVYADGVELGGVHAGEDGYGEKLRRAGERGSGDCCGLEHGGASAGV